MNTCSTCIYWRAHHNPVDEPITGDCMRVEDLSRPTIDNQLFNIYTEASDSSGLMVELWTGKDFGCILHSQNQS